MICDQCKQREARVFLTQIMGDAVQKVQLCEECARDVGLENAMNPAGLGGHTYRQGGVEEFLVNVTRHPREAYEFVCEALEICRQWQAHRSKTEGTQTISHVSGQELLEFIRELALAKFGKQAKTVLGGWKVFRTEDFGEIVFDLVDARLLMKTPEDSREDFQNGYNFDEAFPEA